VKAAVVNALMILTAVGSAAPPEPQYLNTFMAVAGDKAINLERQTVTIKAKVKFGGFGGAKATSEFKPGKSPVRFHAGEPISFVVRSAAAGTTIDPNTLYVLRVLKSKSHSRELTMMDSHGPFAMAGVSANLAEGVIPIQFEPFGEYSLKASPVNPLAPGEYAFSFRNGLLDLFCFGVD
jgi:hypothetical protein